MLILKNEIDHRSKRFEYLKSQVQPLIEALGDLYEVDGIKAQIIRSKSWQVDATKLLNKFGKKVYSLLTVSHSGFLKAFEAGMFGTKANLKGISKLVNNRPKFLLSQKKK